MSISTDTKINLETITQSFSLPSISNEAKNFVQRLLERNVNKRMTIKEVLTHPWITKFCGKDMIEQRKMSNGINNFALYSSISPKTSKMF